MQKEVREKNSIRHVLICEDHPFVQLGLEVSLRNLLPGLESLYIASTGKEALAYATKQRPDLALVDLGLPDMSGLEIIQQLKKIFPVLQIVVVTSSDNPSILLQAKSLGVSGIVQKSSSRDHLNSVIEHLVKGEPLFLDPSIRTLLQSYENVEFTPREYEVLVHITQGLSNQEIADRLGCAITTVRFHRSNIMDKANMRNAAELTAWFLQGQRQRS